MKENGYLTPIRILRFYIHSLLTSAMDKSDIMLIMLQKCNDVHTRLIYLRPNKYGLVTYIQVNQQRINNI